MKNTEHFEQFFVLYVVWFEKIQFRLFVQISMWTGFQDRCMEPCDVGLYISLSAIQSWLIEINNVTRFIQLLHQSPVNLWNVRSIRQFPSLQLSTELCPPLFPNTDRWTRWHPHRHTTDNSPITCEAVSRTSRCGRVIPSAAMDTYQQYPSQMLMNWGVYLTDQGAMQGGQGVYSDPWSSPVSTVNTVNTVTSLLKNGQTIFNQDWNTVPINSYGTVSILYIAFLLSNMLKSYVFFRIYAKHGFCIHTSWHRAYDR